MFDMISIALTLATHKVVLCKIKSKIGEENIGKIVDHWLTNYFLRYKIRSSLVCLQLNYAIEHSPYEQA